jgi:hypothetical protein
MPICASIAPIAKAWIDAAVRALTCQGGFALQLIELGLGAAQRLPQHLGLRAAIVRRSRRHRTGQQTDTLAQSGAIIPQAGEARSRHLSGTGVGILAGGEHPGRPARVRYY